MTEIKNETREKFVTWTRSKGFGDNCPMRAVNAFDAFTEGLRQGHEEALEEAAQTSDGIVCGCGTRNASELISRRVRALKAGHELADRALSGCGCAVGGQDE